MILSLLKTYALQAALAALGAVSLFAGVQTWRLDNAQETIAEQRQLIVDVKAANLTQQATIEALRKANADWSNKCKADSEKWSSKLAEMVKQAQLGQEALKNAKAKREIIYKESKDECAFIPIPEAIKERMK